MEATQIKERPIIFNGEMVRAILDGRKTQTRRVIKEIKEPWAMNDPITAVRFGTKWMFSKCIHTDDVPALDVKCPYGQPGDRLWVRETWGYHGTSSCGDDHKVLVRYRSNDEKKEIYFDSYEAMGEAVPKQNIKHPDGFNDLEYWQRGQIHSDLLSEWWSQKKTIPSIHMPRWASRISLEVTGVRMERVQEIREEDAFAESLRLPPIESTVSHGGREMIDVDGWWKGKFKKLWDSINGKKHPWDSNPWVWVIEFRRIET